MKHSIKVFFFVLAVSYTIFYAVVALLS